MTRSSSRRSSDRSASVTGPTTDRATVLDAIAAIRHKGGTAILDAARRSARALLAERDAPQAVVLITDGYDENSESQVDRRDRDVEGAAASRCTSSASAVSRASR